MAPLIKLSLLHLALCGKRLLWTFGPAGCQRAGSFCLLATNIDFDTARAEGQYKTRQQTNQAASGAIGSRERIFSAERCDFCIWPRSYMLKELKKRSESAQSDGRRGECGRFGHRARSDPQTVVCIVAARHNQNNLLRALLKGKVSDQ
jgi:hypothetical protein